MVRGRRGRWLGTNPSSAPSAFSSLPPAGTAGPGEVLLKIRGGTEAYLAWSINPIPKGATVLVIENRGSRTVDVSEWADPLDPFPE